MTRILDILAKYQNYFLAFAIFISLSAVSFTSIGGSTNLNLKNYPLVIFLLIAISILLAILYIVIDKRRIKALSKQINTVSVNERDDMKSKLPDLTKRQKEVYDLIISGKSNKEIMALLFIEQSTLKTHINQIYKKLDITSRKDLKNEAH